ncbi:MAG: hypothetical protein L0G94_10170 [Brachybacterium sp.]|uniref:hypothetical protein n=1 Tax=Brachybacterium sp. TaxID=1891286 RepID=UPI002649E54E|nr:hypothetical protein [Brachybacterium sp.]MDN5687019.1 hypothetical protein [Brachybacterium sp.]
MTRTARTLTIAATALLALTGCGASGPEPHDATEVAETRVNDAGATCDWKREVHDEYTLTTCGDGTVLFILGDEQSVLNDQDEAHRDDYSGGCTVRGQDYVGFAKGEGVEWVDSSFDSGCATPN